MDEELKKLRKEIDRLDEETLSLLEKRVDIAKRIGATKKSKGLPVSDPQREREVLDNLSKSTKLDKDFVKKLFTSIIEYCKDEEKK
jgi:chorismate mutase